VIRPRVAVIAAAGFGGRMMPVTKSISKEMLPVGNRPIVDYAVENAVKAGVEKIIFITREDDDQLRSFYSKPKQALVDGLASIGKTNIIPDIEYLHTLAEFVFVDQPHDGRYGTGLLPVIAQQALESEELFWLLAGDNAAFRPDGRELELLLQTLNEHDMHSAIACTEVPLQNVGRYGVIEYQDSNDHKIFNRIVEKPAPDQAPSNLINISSYLFHADIIDICKTIEITDNEYLLTDAFEEYSKRHPMLTWPITGSFIDVGNPKAFAEANQLVINTIRG